MALKRGDDLAQRIRPGELAVKKRDKLVARGQLAHEFIAPMPLHKPIEDDPRNEFQNIAENSILMAHGVDPFSSPDDLLNLPNRVESMPCALSTKLNRTAVGQARP
jgi:hypothetical protein